MPGAGRCQCSGVSRSQSLKQWEARGGIPWSGHVYDLFVTHAPKLKYDWPSPLEHISQLRWMIKNHPELIGPPN
jgi:hypothetical protein